MPQSEFQVTNNFHFYGNTTVYFSLGGGVVGGRLANGQTSPSHPCSLHHYSTPEFVPGREILPVAPQRAGPSGRIPNPPTATPNPLIGATTPEGEMLKDVKEPTLEDSQLLHEDSISSNDSGYETGFSFFISSLEEQQSF